MRVVFFGATELGYKCCELIANKQLGEIVGIFTIPSEYRISHSDQPVKNRLFADFKPLAARLDVPLLTTEGRLSEKEEELVQLKPDLLLAIGWYYNIPPAVRAIAPLGCIGLHASLLPRYRGGAPLVWAMINGERETGVSLFYLEDGIDSGPIVAQTAFAIEPTDTIRELLTKATCGSLELIEQYLPLIATGSAPKLPQDATRATYVPQRSPDDGMIDWSWSASRIRNFIRAQTRPYPGAFTIIEGKKVTLWDVDVEER